MTPEQALAVHGKPMNSQAPADPTAALEPSSPTPARLTDREVEVLRLLAQGFTNAQIAEQPGDERADRQPAYHLAVSIS